MSSSLSLLIVYLKILWAKRFQESVRLCLVVGSVNYRTISDRNGSSFLRTLIKNPIFYLVSFLKRDISTISTPLQIAGFNGLSEAVRRLDFSSAVRDVRRFNYICALLELLVGGQRLTHLPGAAQKLLLSMLEQLADQGQLATLASRVVCFKELPTAYKFGPLGRVFSLDFMTRRLDELWCRLWCMCVWKEYFPQRFLVT